MKLYVGNLPWSTGEAELEEMFAGIGEVRSANVITCLLYTSDAADE